MDNIKDSSKTIVFDTHAYFLQLKSAGVHERQANIQADAMSKLVNNNIARHEDLEILYNRLTKDIQTLENKIDTNFENFFLKIRKNNSALQLKIITILGSGLFLGGLITLALYFRAH